MPNRSPAHPEETGFHRYKVEIALLIVGAIISAIISVTLFSYQVSQTQKSEQRSLATGYLLEIENIEPSLTRLVAFNASANTTDFHPVAPLDSFYPSYGLYYSNRVDISKFDPETSASLYRFYYHLLRAEDQRLLLLNFDIDHPANATNPADAVFREALKKGIYLNMMADLNLSVSEIPELKAKLQTYAAG